MKLLFTLIFVLATNLCVSQELSDEDFAEIKSSRNFTGKVVLVTGSSSGIGRAIVSLFARFGAQVVITGDDSNLVRGRAQEARELSPKSLKPLEIVANMTRSKDIRRLIDETVSRFGRLDILINNGGLPDWAGIKHKNFMQVFDKMLRTHLRSAVYLTYLSVPHLMKTNGTVVSVSHILASNPRPFTTAFAIAKAGIDVMTRVLSMELGPYIRVNCVSPGMVDSELVDKDDRLLKFVKDRARIDAPLKRLTTTLDVAKGVIFLASTDAKFITGVNLRIDGGLMFNAL